MEATAQSNYMKPQRGPSMTGRELVRALSGTRNLLMAIRVGVA